MIFVYILLAVMIAMTAWMYFETCWLQVVRIDLSNGRKGLKIVHISDIHINMQPIPASKVRQAIKKEDPDIVILSGDYINKPLHASDFLEFLGTVCKGYKTFLCLGNHDLRAFGDNKRGLDAFLGEIKSLHVEVLENSCAVVKKGTSYYNIIGIGDLRLGNPDVDKAIKGCIPDVPKIAFTHNPDLVLQIPGKIVDYLFCGHFHGGQIWTPFNLEFILLRKDKLCRMGVKRGLHKVNDIQLYINRGLGNVALPLRFLSRPEITVYNIK